MAGTPSEVFEITENLDRKHFHSQSISDPGNCQCYGASMWL